MDNIVKQAAPSIETDFRSIKKSAKKIKKYAKSLNRLAMVELSDLQAQLKMEKASRAELEIQLKEKDRVLAAITSCNEAMATASDEENFLDQVCQLIVRSGGYRFVWVGFAQNDKNKSVKPIAQHGFNEGYLDDLKITWSDTAYGRGPTGRAIRNRRPEVCQDIAKDPQFKMWQKEAGRRGFSSSLALPLLIDDSVLGALNLYSHRKDAFRENEISLLSNMAADIAYGIQSFRDNKERRIEEQRNKQSLLSKITISALLETSLEPLTLTRQLEVALDLILSVPWLAIEKKGSIFLVDKHKKQLNLVVQSGLASPLLTTCQNVAFGYCLCGRAAESEKVVFSSHIEPFAL